MNNRVICDFCRRVGIGSTYEERNADNTRHEMTCPANPDVVVRFATEKESKKLTVRQAIPTDPDAAQAKDEKEMAMYVVMRVVNGVKLFAGSFGLKYKTFELAKVEAKRLAELYAAEKPRYEIYELVYHCAVEASIDLRVT